MTIHPYSSLFYWILLVCVIDAGCCWGLVVKREAITLLVLSGGAVGVGVGCGVRSGVG